MVKVYHAAMLMAVFLAPALWVGANTTTNGKKWHTVQILQGTTTKRGEKFTVGSEWRIHWKVKMGEWGVFTARAESATGEYIDDQQIVATQKTGQDVTMGAKPGTYSLDVIANDCTWALKVEELR